MKDANGKYTDYAHTATTIDTVAYIGSATYNNATNIVTVATGVRNNGKVEEFAPSCIKASLLLGNRAKVLMS